MRSLVTTFLLIISLLYLTKTHAQIDASLLKRIQKDTTKTLNMDALYNRPALNIEKTPISIGGYLETNWQHLTTDGVSEGHQFQARRLSIFMSSAISKRVKFLSEIEFEDGGKEVAVEFASVDVEFHPLVNFRAGILLNPIGSFNQNHDGPKWEFTDRPISATQMLPGTFSNAGAGFFGKKYSGKWMIGYEAYFTGNFDNSIIENKENKTFLPAAKKNPERFEEINSGQPLFTGKLALRNNKIGELGISYMGGIYNKFQDDGIILDEKRRINVFAIDFNTTLPKIKTFITAEFAWINVDVPTTYTQQFGNKQHGGFIDIVQPIVNKTILDWEKATLNLACRLEYVDWNVGKFNETGGNMGEDIWSIMPAISFRPTPETVIRLNYRFQKQHDILNNPPAITDGFSLGLSTYF
ncbi:hypothetical protein H1R85_07450 [Flavobacterium psychrophilum]|uniref:hypothetical protein n=1 Tax=Flavobacterium psychrophilum TaxID=96345 RepID=UPI000B7C51B6|nr:hypothetical protein [Flavobacterium psychrophilum]MBF2092340.1 hypothetical protein [Flavobacterium psychrophilum]SNA65848.1 conserved hypothetical protein [Flavobacterium psychrophilum]SNB03205.1 conserved hypothetical protein [Flavobacterium psychrophilum]